MVDRPRYDAFTDMLEVHREIGYLLTVAAMLAVYDVGMLTANLIWPAEDTYLVPGVEAAGYVGVDWGVQPPDVPSVNLESEPHGNDLPAITLPDISLMATPAPEKTAEKPTAEKSSAEKADAGVKSRPASSKAPVKTVPPPPAKTTP